MKIPYALCRKKSFRALGPKYTYLLLDVVSSAHVQNRTSDFMSGAENTHCPWITCHGCEVSLRVFSFALASEVGAFYDFSVMRLRDSDSENRNWTVPETWAAVNKGKKLVTLAANLIMFN